MAVRPDVEVAAVATAFDITLVCPKTCPFNMLDLTLVVLCVLYRREAARRHRVIRHSVLHLRGLAMGIGSCLGVCREVFVLEGVWIGTRPISHRIPWQHGKRSRTLHQTRNYNS